MEVVMRFRAAVVLLLLIAALPACRHALAPSDPNLVTVNGTVRFMTFEGGFWAIRGDDNVTYDPLGGVPPAFQSEGLRVRIEARRRNDMASVHMAWPMVEIISITKLP
jgi:hypothetical protein